MKLTAVQMQTVLKGRRIVKVEPRAFRTGKKTESRECSWTYDPYFTLDDGSRIHFVVEETEVGAYGINVVMHGTEGE